MVTKAIVATIEHKKYLQSKADWVGKIDGPNGYSGIEVHATSKPLAIEALDKVVRNLAGYAFTKHYRWSSDGLTVFILNHNGHNWQYEIVHAHRTHGSACLLHPDYTEQQAIEMMERHASDYVTGE